MSKSGCGDKDLFRFPMAVRSRTTDRLAIALCLTAVAYCICCAALKLHRVSIDVAALPQTDPAAPEISGRAFAPDKVPGYMDVPPFKGSVKMYASWGTPLPPAGWAYSAWYKPAAHFGIFIAGYPNRFDNQLGIEVQTAKAGVIRLPVPPELIPGQAWWLKTFSLPEDERPLKFRIFAIAAPRDWQGWLGFSEPFVIRSVNNVEICKQLLWILLTAATAIVAFLSPGLILRRKRPNLPFIWIPLLGMALFAFVGLAAWIGPPQLSPRLICRIGLFLMIGFATYNVIRFPLSTYIVTAERQVLLVFLLLVSLATAKTIYSLGPEGELFAAKNSRTYEVGARSDSRFSYHTIQLVRFRESPFGQFAGSMYAPWSFSHRGPIAGLAATPIVLSARVNVLHTWPDQAWCPFDPEGLEAYRIAMIVLACCGLLTVFGLAKLFLPDMWAFFAFLIAATAPFTVHEIYFTWPKLPEAGCVLLAAYLLFKTRYLLAGLVLGFGYLVHPSALICLPALIGIIILQKRKPSVPYSWIREIFPMSLGVGFWLVLWRVINERHYAQDYFFEYFKMTAGAPPTVANWFRSRADSLLNTLVPLNLILFHRQSLELQSIYEFSPPVIQFFVSYWSTLPFGAGIAFFLAALLRLVYVGYRKARAWLMALFVIPFALFVPYWGWGSSGLLREGLHAWFLGLMMFVVIIWYRHLRTANCFFRVVNWTLLFRGVETICVLLLPTIASQHAFVQQPWILSDTVALAVIFTPAFVLYAFVFRYAERLRGQSMRADLSLATDHATVVGETHAGP